MDILILTVNVFFMGSTAIITTLSFIVYLLNLFKKRSVLESWYLYGDDEKCTSFWTGVICGVICAACFAQDAESFYGLSLGSVILLFCITLVLVCLIFEGIGMWFKNLPES